MGKLLIIAGILIILVGLFLEFGGKIPFFGKLPGDFSFQKGNFRIQIPLASSLILSILLTFIFLIIRWLRS